MSEMSMIDRMVEAMQQRGLVADDPDAKAVLAAIRDYLPREVYLAANAIPITRYLPDTPTAGDADFYVTGHEAQDIWAAMIDAIIAS